MSSPYDPETGLPGRVLVLDRLTVATARSERTGTVVAVLLAEAGDDVGAAAERLQDAIRAGDSVGRTGERQLAVIADDLTGVAEAEAAGRRALALLGAGAAIGLTVADGARRDPREMLAEAEAALARARERGGGCETFDAELLDRAIRRARSEAELRRAIAAGELRLHYQPILDIDDGTMRGIEALVRWEHPEHGLLGPDEFVPVAEESGAIVPLGGWVLHDACSQVAAWHASRPDALAFWLAVNVSAGQLAHPATADMVQRALAESGLDPDLLYLEVAERDLASAPEAATVALRRLRALGAHVSISGATAAWRRRAEGLEVDMVKADPKHVVAVLAASGEAEVVGERIEDREQEVMLREHGGRLAQGFLYAHPATAEEVEPLLDVLPPAPVPEECPA